MNAKNDRLKKIIELEKSGHWQEMLILCEQWIDEEPDDPNSWLGVGNSLRGLSKPEEAVEMYRTGISKAFQYVDDSTGQIYDVGPIWYQLGHAYDELGQPEEAVEALLEAIENDPDVEDIWNDLGVIYLNMNPRKVKEAFEAFSKALDLNQKNTITLKNLGIVYAMCDSKQGVEQILQRLANIDKLAADNFLQQAQEILAQHK